jgi:hypothetical protein
MLIISKNGWGLYSKMPKKEAKLWDRTEKPNRVKKKKEPRSRITLPPLSAPSIERERGREREREEEGLAVERKEEKFCKCKFAFKPLNFGCFDVGFWISIVVGCLLCVVWCCV